MGTNLKLARWIALLLPLALLAGALGSQHFGGLVPCEMCMWQRYPHYLAVLVAAASFFVQHRATRTLFILFAGVLIAVSGGIGVYHAGVEYHWWHGLTGCTSNVDTHGSAADVLARIVQAPIVRCDTAQWTLGGVSLAGFNAIFSLAGAIAIFALASRRTAA